MHLCGIQFWLFKLARFLDTCLYCGSLEVSCKLQILACMVLKPPVGHLHRYYISHPCYS
ncbi:hypothetical protein BDN67DRAFT_975930, partial [Paxillus ammoniavirescens]